MVMKETWFQYPECTTQQAEELMAKYRSRGIAVERSLNADFVTWTVSARLPEGKNPPRASRQWQSRMWG
ncbi:hypothetical protein HV107_20950 [Enterobacter sp. RHBSTW-00175]|nr:hypothetical protein [Enterobacter sp. RHBSTW-00175]QMR77921.1 hypothetical protein HV107_20950 [Enterobacter sp. RHBSTW-00175]